MNIEWSKVTWYSKLTAVILFVVTFFIAFNLGEQKATIKSTTPAITPFDITANWKTFSDTLGGITFKYPTAIPAKYIDLFTWPPKVELVSGTFVCSSGGDQIQANGETTTETINGHQYCVTKLVQGAAGSMYTEYGYVAKIQNKYVSFAFTIRSVQCANYPEPEQTACLTERAVFNFDSTIDQVIQSTRLSS